MFTFQQVLEVKLREVCNVTIQIGTHTFVLTELWTECKRYKAKNRWWNKYWVVCWHSVKIVTWHRLRCSFKSNSLFDDAGAIAIIGTMKAGQRHPVAVCRFGSFCDLVLQTEPVSHNTTMPTISLHDLINGIRRPTPHRYIRDTSDIYMYWKFGYVSRSIRVSKHSLVWHNTTLDVKCFAEFRLSRERKHCSDSASCLQLARRFANWACTRQPLASVVDSRLAAVANERKLCRARRGGRRGGRAGRGARAHLRAAGAPLASGDAAKLPAATQ